MKLLFNQIIGTGGIGTGVLFQLDSNRSLSRNETRLAMLSPTRDYCKQHIILHYVARILSPEATVYPIGMVGADDAGMGLLQQMRAAGMETTFVHQTAQRPTMYCVCMQYPDKAVCNVTTSESACALVDRKYVACMLAELPKPMGKDTLAVAVPEVPVEARLELLMQAKAAGAYCVSSCLVDEFAAFSEGGGLKWTDLLVINEDEAMAYCGADIPDLYALAVNCHTKLCQENPDARLILTCGARGSYACERGVVKWIPSMPTDVVATGGAGDAYTAGIICGLALGLPFMPGSGVSATELGAKLAAEAISVADTIAEHINHDILREFLKDQIEMGKLDAD